MLKLWFNGRNILAMKSASWHMPDGTKTTNRPRDGAIMHTFDSQGNATTWQWDDFLESWHNVSSGTPTPQKTATFNMSSLSYRPKEEEEAVKWSTEPLKCECGSDAVGSPRHSTWCIKYHSQT